MDCGFFGFDDFSGFDSCRGGFRGDFRDGCRGDFRCRRCGRCRNGFRRCGRCGGFGFCPRGERIFRAFREGFAVGRATCDDDCDCGRWMD